MINRLPGIRTLYRVLSGKFIRHKENYVIDWEGEEIESRRPVRSEK